MAKETREKIKINTKRNFRAPYESGKKGGLGEDLAEAKTSDFR